MGLLEDRARAGEQVEGAEPVRADEALEAGLVVTVRELGEADVDLGEIELVTSAEEVDHLHAWLADPDLAVLGDDQEIDHEGIQHLEVLGTRVMHHAWREVDDGARVDVLGQHVLADGTRRDDAEQVLGEAGHVDEAVVAEHLREGDGPLLGQAWDRGLDHETPLVLRLG